MVKDGSRLASGSWKTMAMSRPRICRMLVEVRVEELAPVEADGAADDVGRGRGQEAQDGQRADGLAAARLTHQSDDLPAPDLEGGFVDHAHGAGLGVELDAEAPHLEERGACRDPLRRLRRPSRPVG